MKFRYPAVLAACLCSAPVHAASEDLDISASVRVRGEAISGQFRPSRAENDAIVVLKTTLALEYDAGPLRFGGELWDARAYGQSRTSSAGTTEINAMELVQAYVRAELDENGASTATLGRFTLDIGSRRLVSRQNFRNTTNAYTGAHVDWNTSGGSRVQLLWAMPHIRLPDDAAGIRDDRVEWDLETTDLQLIGAHVTVPGVLGGIAEVYGFALEERDAPGRQTRNRRLRTPGARLFRKPSTGNWDHDIEAAYQFGHIRQSTAANDLTDLDVSAWFAHAEAGRTFAGGWKPRISLHMDVASGDGGRPGSFGRFDSLYGARRFEFGPTSLYGAFGRANIVSPGVRLDFVPAKRLDGFVMARSAWAENPRDSFSSTGVRDAGAAAGSFAGHQFEGRVRYWLVPKIGRLDVGFVYLAKGKLLEQSTNAPRTGDTAYGYVDLTFTF